METCYRREDTEVWRHRGLEARRRPAVGVATWRDGCLGLGGLEARCRRGDMEIWRVAVHGNMETWRSGHLEARCRHGDHCVLGHVVTSWRD